MTTTLVSGDFRGSAVLRLPTLLISALLILTGCAGGSSSDRTAPIQAGEGARVEQSGPPKVIRIGSIREPNTGLAVFVQSDAGKQHTFVFQAGLTVFDDQGSLQPQIAQKVPGLDDGDWKLLPDGGMEVTWKLRPNVKWHDGTPLSAEDFVFGLQVAQDPEMPLDRTPTVRLISQATAPDAETLVLRWGGPHAYGNRGGALDLSPIPRHLMADLYRQGDKQSFINHPYWTTQFVGLGPYRMGEWVQGSYTEGLAFDQYFLGRPKIDRVLIRYFTDANVLVAATLAGDIDMVGVGGLKLDEILPIKSSWDPQGAGTVFRMNQDLTLMFLQFRDPNAPWARDLRARQALVHLIDRQSLAETFLYGLEGAGPADVLVDRQNPVFPLLERGGLPRYPYDVARAGQLLAQSGWTKGPDGVFQNGGERFAIEVRVQANTQGNVQEGLAAMDQWKRGGLDATFLAIPGNAANRNEMKATIPGVFHTREGLLPETMENFTVSQVPTERNGWRGRNFGAYNNPAYEQRYVDFESTLEGPRRLGLYADLLRLAAEDLPFIPLYYTSASGTTVYRRGVTGPGPVPVVHPFTTWNIHTWQVD
jgi:peptide/nickel transport system substrate-binding protein